MSKLIIQFDTISGAAVIGDYLTLWDDSAEKEVKILMSAWPGDLNIARYDTAAEWSEAQNMGDVVVQRPELKDYGETVQTIAASGASRTLDMTQANVFDVTLDQACTFAFANPPATGRMGSFTLFLRQDATGSRLVTWPASVKWPFGAAPTLSTPGGTTDILSFMTVDGGATWYGFLAGEPAAAPVSVTATPSSITQGNSTTLGLSDTTGATSVRYYLKVGSTEFDIATVGADPFTYAWEPDEGTYDVLADITYAGGTVTTAATTVTVTLP